MRLLIRSLPALLALPPLATCAPALAETRQEAPEVRQERPESLRAGPTEAAQEAPRLVVLLVVDQLPAEILDRYDDLFTGGLRRLRDDGLRFTNATHDHAITETAPGHATIATGTEPRQHGIASNEWWEATDGPQFDLILNVVETETPTLGEPRLAGASPARLMRDGLADWLLDASPGSRVVSVSGKDRGAVLLGGHAAEDVYWFSPDLGRFVTSVHYADEYPGWIDDFNDDVVPGFRTDSVWALEVPEHLRDRARPDATAGEEGGDGPTFPHTLGKARTYNPELGHWFWWAGTPGLDAMTLALAEVALEEADLGDDDAPDLLAVSLSATDRVGHAYGPGSLEQLDNLLRLDRDLGRFLDRVDETVGEGRAIVVLTSDHSSMDLPEVRTPQGLPGGRLTRDSVAALQDAVNRAAGEATSEADRAERLAETVTTASWVDRAWTHAELENPPAAPDSFTVLQVNAYYPGRFAGLLSRAGVEMQLGEGILTWSIPTGTTHGSPWYYDRHVPWIMAGGGIQPGVRPERVSVADIAPTLASLLGLPVPGDLDGVDRRVGGGG